MPHFRLSGVGWRPGFPATDKVWAKHDAAVFVVFLFVDNLSIASLAFLRYCHLREELHILVIFI